MIAVEPKSIKSSNVPNVYVKSVHLEDAGSLDLRVSTAVGSSENVRTSRRYPGAEISYDPARRARSSDAQAGSIKSTLKIAIQDTFSGGNPQGWLARRNKGARGDFNLKIIQCTNSRLARILSGGSQLDQVNFSMPRGFVEFVDYDMQTISLTNEQAHKETLVIEENPNFDVDVVSLFKEVVFNIPQSNPRYLSYFVFCELSVNGSGAPRTNIHSPVVFETVIERSRILSNLNLLVDSSENIWAGPAHQHPTIGWMEGAFHTDAPHGALVRRAVPNFKIRDSRILNQALETPVDLTIPESERRHDYFSNLYLSRGDENSSSFMVNFNHLNYMVNNSKFGKLFLNSSPRIVQQLLLNSKITDLSVVRRKVRTSLGQNNLESSAERIYGEEYDEETTLVTTSEEGSVLRSMVKYNAPGGGYNTYALLPEGAAAPGGYVKTAQIQEINTSLNGMRSISVVDLDMASRTDGKYQYFIRLQVDDGAFAYLRSKQAELRRSLRSMLDYKQRADMEGEYNQRTGQFSQRFITREVDSFNYIVLNPQEVSTPANSISSRSSQKSIQPWLAAIVKYVEILDLMTNVTQARKADISRAIYSSINPITGDPEGVGRFINLLNSLDSKLQSALDPVRLGHTRDKSSSSQASPQRFISTEKRFSEVFDANAIRSTGFDYFSNRDRSDRIVTLTVDEFKQRANREFARYNSNVYDQEQLQDFDFLTDQMVGALVSDTTRYSYLAPSSIDVSSRTVDLFSDSRDNLDFTAVKVAILSAVSEGSSRSLSTPVRSGEIAMLSDSNRGPARDRLDRLEGNIRSLAETRGVFVERGQRRITRTSGMRTTMPADEPIASAEGFSKASAQEPDNTSPSAPDNVGALSVLTRLTDRSTQSRIGAGAGRVASVPLIYFDLTRVDNLINSNIVSNNQTRDATQRAREIANTIDLLPTQIKLLLRNRGSYYNNTT